MLSSIWRMWLTGLTMAGLFLLPVYSRGEPDRRPTNEAGDIGIGAELGEPGSWWAVTGKIWADPLDAFQPAVNFNGSGAAFLQLDYLRHGFDIIRPADTDTRVPLYIGLGGTIAFQHPHSVGVRVPLGISFIFPKWDVPVDVYFQVVPTFWFYDVVNTCVIYPELGMHFYL